MSSDYTLNNKRLLTALRVQAANLWTKILSARTDLQIKRLSVRYYQVNAEIVDLERRVGK